MRVIPASGPDLRRDQHGPEPGRVRQLVPQLLAFEFPIWRADSADSIFRSSTSQGFAPVAWTSAVMFHERSQRLLIPSDLPVGHLIGKRGCNVRHLKQLSGAEIFIDPGSTGSGVAILRGTAAAVSKAVELLQRQFEAWKSSGKSLEITCKDLLLLI